MCFSTIVAAEFAIGQPLTDLPLKNFRAIPFNIPHSIEAARLWNALVRDSGDSRAVVRDDVKLMSTKLSPGFISHWSSQTSTPFPRSCRAKSSTKRSLSSLAWLRNTFGEVMRTA
jgi:hypothetical protein